MRLLGIGFFARALLRGRTLRSDFWMTGRGRQWLQGGDDSFCAPAPFLSPLDLPELSERVSGGCLRFSSGSGAAPASAPVFEFYAPLAKSREPTCNLAVAVHSGSFAGGLGSLIFTSLQGGGSSHQGELGSGRGGPFLASLWPWPGHRPA